MSAENLKTPERRDITQERRRVRRSRRLRVGAVAAAGSLAFVGVAGASSQNEELRASLASFTSPLRSPEPTPQATAEQETAAEPTTAAETAPADPAPAETAEAVAAAEQEAAAQAAAAGVAAQQEAAQQEAARQEAAAAAEQAAAAERTAARAAAAETARVAAEDQAAAAAAAASAPVDDPAAAKAYAASALAGHGWAASEITCLDTLWEKESNWKTSATNASSGAYGIVQSLPAEKMATSGADYLTNYRTQINWGLSYIESRYGSPCSALNFHYANNWY